MKRQPRPTAAQLKDVIWIGDSLDAVRGFPEEVRSEVGYALEVAQRGGKHVSAKPMRELETVEVVADFDGDTYRSVYTIKLAGFVYVLHCFQKKSKRGIATPRSEVELIRKRLKDAKEDHKRRTEHHGL